MGRITSPKRATSGCHLLIRRPTTAPHQQQPLRLARSLYLSDHARGPWSKSERLTLRRTKRPIDQSSHYYQPVVRHFHRTDWFQRRPVFISKQLSV